MRLKILNDIQYNKFVEWQIDTAFQMHKGEWHCETADGFLVVRATPAVISMGFAEREVNKTDEMCIVGGVMDKKNKLIIASMFGSMYDDEGYITFGEIAKFMKWQINKEQIWDG